MASDTRGLIGRRYPPLLRDLTIAWRLIWRDGIGTTLRHAKAISLRRMHRLLFDRSHYFGLPFPLVRQSLLTGLTLRTSRPAEAVGAAPCSAVPCKTLEWAIRGAGVDVASCHFVDIGSGTGWALQLAMRYPFRAFTGVEFARELHEKARANVNWLAAQGRTQGRPVDLRHESALETELPSGPCLLMMFSPFDEHVMRPFLSRVEASVNANPRPMTLLYVNPSHAELFVRPGIGEIKLARFYQALIRWFSPYDVLAYRFEPRTV